jgi:hypothetical protein
MPRWPGALLLAALAVHTLAKGHGQAWEMLWACHVASTVLALGVLTGRALPSAAGFLFHVGMGFPGWLLDVIATRTTSVTSVVVHLLPLAVGAVAAMRLGYPRRAYVFAWLLWVVLQPLSLLAPPALDVNLVQSPWGPLARYVRDQHLYQLANAALALLTLYAVSRAIERVLRRRAVAAAAA